MSTITADPALQSILSNVNGVTEIRDPDGKLLGIYTPEQCVRSAKPDYTEVRKLFDPVEIARRKEHAKSDPGKSLAEIMERLNAGENNS